MSAYSYVPPCLLISTLIPGPYQDPREGYIARAVREYYKDLEGLKNDDPVMKKAVKLDKRSYEQQMRSQLEIVEPPTKSKFGNPGGEGKLLPVKLERSYTTGSST